MRAHLQVNLVTRWANATKHLLSLCIYIIPYLSNKSKKPHNLVRLSGFLSNSKFYGESRLPTVSYLFYYYNVSVKQIQTPVWLYLMQPHRGFLFLYFSLSVLILAFLCCFLERVALDFLERKLTKIHLNVHFFCWKFDFSFIFYAAFLKASGAKNFSAVKIWITLHSLYALRATRYHRERI